MVWIQYTLRRRMKTNLLCLLLCLYCGIARAQSGTTVLNLAKPTVNTLSYKFFVQEVEDLRKERSTSIGKVIVFDKESSAVLPNSPERFLRSRWITSTAKTTDGRLPVYISIKTFHVNEKKVAPNKVTGEISLHVTYRWYRNMQPVELTSFQTTAQYTRPGSEPFYEKIAGEILDKSLIHLNNWIINNTGKSAALAKNLLLTFKESKGTNSQDTVFYDPNRPLIWADFKGTNRRPGSRFAAAVFTSFAYEGRSFPRGENLVVEINLKVFTVMSWVRPESRNASTLRHEQLHFDITRMVVEQFKNALIKADLTIEDYDSEIQYQFLEIFRNMNREQEAYDQETGHGLQPGAQAAWDKKITEEIKRIYSVQ